MANIFTQHFSFATFSKIIVARRGGRRPKAKKKKTKSKERKPQNICEKFMAALKGLEISKSVLFFLSFLLFCLHFESHKDAARGRLKSTRFNLNYFIDGDNQYNFSWR